MRVGSRLAGAGAPRRAVLRARRRLCGAQGAPVALLALPRLSLARLCHCSGGNFCHLPRNNMIPYFERKCRNECVIL